ncbi:LuxR C-terminal-related transcriptional regulator [Nocardia sp. NPDC056000]|uniref:LuxR C-terminal-related transcriptional regulator n=1 Tax=Nocardia sp. NPDC056000 TaxID=3345674 RepID=UPI0035E05522
MILNRTAPELIAWLHHRIAELLHSRGAESRAVGRHLVKAGYARFPGAVTILRVAGDDALVHDEPHVAVEFLELAYRACANTTDRTTIAAALVSTEWRFNPSTTTRSFTRLLTVARSDRLPVGYLPQLINYLAWHGCEAEARQLSIALARRSDQANGPIVPQVQFIWKWMTFTHPEVLDGLGVVDLTHAPPASNASPYLLATSVLAGLLPGGGTESAVLAAQRVLSGHRLGTTTVAALVVAVEGLIYLDRLNDAAAWCDTLLAEASARSAPTWQALFAGLRAEVFLRKGDMSNAVQMGLAALNYVPARHLGTRIGRPLACLIMGLTAAGAHQEARKQLERQVPYELFQSRFGLHYLHARGHHYLATEQYREALLDFQRCGELMRRWRLDLPHLVPWRNDLAQVYLAMGRPDRAHEHAAAHLRQLDGAVETHRTTGVSLRLLALAAEPESRVRLLTMAAKVARRHDDKYELATTLAALGAAYQDDGRGAQGKSLLRTATRLLREATAVTAHGVAEAERPSAESDTPAEPRDLSPAERRVADLAALGRRNRDIADELRITTSTVEQHLTQVYRKLRVRRRAELQFLLRPTGSMEPRSAEITG